MLVAIWLISVCYAGGLTLADPDLWGHTLYGRRAIDQGVLTEQVDPFSYTEPGAQWTNHEWLTEYQYGWLWTQYGNAGLWMWKAALVLVLFLIAGKQIFQTNCSVPAAILLLVFSAFSLSEFAVFIRPQISTFVLLIATLFILRRYWDHPNTKGVYLLPVLTFFWVNLHGGFLAGLGIQGLFLLGYFIRQWKNPTDRSAFLKLLAVHGASWLATLANPYGYRLHAMLWQHLGTEQFVREWQPLWAVHQSPAYYLPFLLIALAVPARKKISGIDILILGVMTALAISHLRHVALLSLAVLILLPVPLSHSLEILFPQLIQSWSKRERCWLRWMLFLGVCSAVFGIQIRGTVHFWKQGIAPWQIAVETNSDSPGVPMQAVGLLKQEQLQGNLLTEYGWAQYVMWQMFPEIKVAFDGRYRTVYSSQMEQNYLAFRRSSEERPISTPLLDEFPTHFVLLSNRNPALRYMNFRSDWRLIFYSEQASLFVRDGEQFQHLKTVLRSDAPSSNRESHWTHFPADPVLAK